MIYTLREYGDLYEKKFCDIFILKEFPEYEKFWQKHVVPLTNRSSTSPDIHFRSIEDAGVSDNSLAISQLHYSLLLHLVRAFNIRKIKPFTTEDYKDLFTEAMARLVGVIDCADELLERFSSPAKYDPWKETEGIRARNEWRNRNGDPLKEIRYYRNKLLHGRTPPAIVIQGTFDRMRLPRVDKQDKYTDWRIVTSGSVGSGGTIRKDFDSPNNIVDDVWEKVLEYLRTSWKKNLLI